MKIKVQVRRGLASGTELFAGTDCDELRQNGPLTQQLWGALVPFSDIIMTNTCTDHPSPKCSHDTLVIIGTQYCSTRSCQYTNYLAKDTLEKKRVNQIAIGSCRFAMSRDISFFCELGGPGKYRFLCILCRAGSEQACVYYTLQVFS